MQKNKDDSLDHTDTDKGRIIWTEEKVNDTATRVTGMIYGDDDAVLAQVSGLHEEENKVFVRDRIVHQLVHGKPMPTGYAEHTAKRRAEKS